MELNTDVSRQRSLADYKSKVTPVWCPGCGHFGVLNAIVKALLEQDLDPSQVALVSGIGCSSRVPAYTSLYGFHGVHGRALAVATGLKLARPELTVLVAGGDGDGFSIGGNHFLHACRRNVDMTYIVMDNQVYGMTKGQASPTTPEDWVGSELTPEGPGISPFHPLAIALCAGANFIARCLSRDTNKTARIITEAMQHPGFAFVQVLSPCITYHPEHHKAWKDFSHYTPFEPTSNLAEAARSLMSDTGFALGVLYKGERPPYLPERTASADPGALHRGFVL